MRPSDKIDQLDFLEKLNFLAWRVEFDRLCEAGLTSPDQLIALENVPWLDGIFRETDRIIERKLSGQHFCKLDSKRLKQLLTALTKLKITGPEYDSVGATVREFIIDRFMNLQDLIIAGLPWEEIKKLSCDELAELIGYCISLKNRPKDAYTLIELVNLPPGKRGLFLAFSYAINELLLSKLTNFKQLTDLDPILFEEVLRHIYPILQIARDAEQFSLLLTLDPKKREFLLAHTQQYRSLGLTLTTLEELDIDNIEWLLTGGYLIPENQGSREASHEGVAAAAAAPDLPTPASMSRR